ncbi:cyclase family protein [Amycolatopsis sp. CA-230715]|uniref:cyclase family protein n=1 Tax=Amycolatopsis sp. CA-230715 TaxID=2745196 RepID=UPI001C0190F0|nr:cyclase family protein [Amycolatopsis sp. CA-230715]QWF85945.1 Kynurenine formamidase [Amycolatopsis sp. CA-230715]
MSTSAETAVEKFLTCLADGGLRVVDLTTKLSADTPTLRLPAPYANLIDFSLEGVSEFDDAGPLWRHNNIHTGEHIGTHLDAPRHWISNRDGADVSEVPVARLIGPAHVLDVSARVAEDPDFLLEIDDIRAWETEHGPLRDGGWLLVRSGWERYGHDREAFLNTTDGVSHTPGISAAAARWLAEEAPIAGYGVETVGIDAGNGFALDPPMPAHHHLLGADKYGITSLRNLGSLPPSGALVVVCPLPIVGGTGSPARVLAVVPGGDGDS